MIRVAVVCEGPTDFRAARTLFDRCAAKHLNLDESDLLGKHREFVVVRGHEYLKWTTVSFIARELAIRPQPQAEDRSPDHLVARKAILTVEHLVPDISVVILLRDQDNDEDRRDAIDKAADRARASVIVGVPRRSIEAWVITAFSPRSPRDHIALREVKDRLPFDPTQEAHRLNGRAGDARDPKQVARDLLGDDVESHCECFRSCDLAELKNRGKNVSVATFIDGVESSLRTLLPRPE
ncbi:MAG: hypothetical protein ACOYN0_12770 [Phycisphaerales bacterium]